MALWMASLQARKMLCRVVPLIGQDGKVGGPVKVVTITPDNRAKMLAESGVRRIEKANEGRSTALRDSFYGRSDA